MICHQKKIIFIHIAKCAGSSVESAFGIDVSNMSEINHSNLFGWDKKNKLYLQHATPKQILENNLIDYNTWDKYYKFIIIRNTWDKMLSDYHWMIKEMNQNDSFKNFISKSGKFKERLNNSNNSLYRGDHLTPQIDYFFIDGKEIKYDRVLKFENLNLEFNKVINDLNLPKDFFIKKENVAKNKKKHYSKYYSNEMIELVRDKYNQDIQYFNFRFEDRRNIYEKIKYNLIKI